MIAKENLLGKTYEELQELFVNLGEKSFRAKQLWSFMYVHGCKSLDDMTNLSKELREKLSQTYSIDRPIITTQHMAQDGTEKYLVKMDDGKEIEAVFIPSQDRGTLCISSQVGCNMGCTFCNTGTQKLVRNLKAHEIIGQVMLLKDIYSDFNLEEEKRRVSNVVFMGMGEPMQNYKEVLKALKILNHNEGLSISRRKITLSTCGIPSRISDLAEDLPVNLSLSLHGSNNQLRSQIMPINNQYNIEELIEVAKEYYEKSNCKKITFVYLMIKGVNDSIENAKELVKIGNQVPCKFNLIPFHPWEGCDYESSSEETMKDFALYLHKHGFLSTIRTTRGDDIMAACGQLKSKSEREKKVFNYNQ